MNRKPLKRGFMSETMDYFRDMFQIYSVKPDTYKTFDLTSNYNYGNSAMGGKESHTNMVQQITAQIGKEIKDRSDQIQELTSVKDNDIVQTILDVMVDDGFNSMSDDSFVSVEYKPTLKRPSKPSKVDIMIQDEIDRFMIKFDLSNLIASFTPDFLLYGEYFLRTEVAKGHGIVSITDDIDLEEHIAIYKAKSVESFIRLNSKAAKYEVEDVNSLSHFILDPQKARIKVQTQNDIVNLPENIKQGKSVVYPILGSLKKLNIMEMSSLAVDLKRVLAPILVTVDVPPNTDVNNVSDIVDRYETYLNDIQKDSANADNMTMGDIIGLANRIKVIPKYTDSKGAMETLLLDKDTADLSDKINNIRKAISLSAGIPSWYVTLGEQMMPKKDMLTIYSRYSRRLVRIQKALGEGIRNLIYKHLCYSDFYINPANIQVKFKAITNVDLLDDVEYMVGLMTTIKDIFTILNEVAASDQNGLEIDDDKMLEFFNIYMSAFPKMSGLLRKYKGGPKVNIANTGGTSPDGDIGSEPSIGGSGSDMGGGMPPPTPSQTTPPSGQANPTETPQTPPSGEEAVKNGSNTIGIGDMF